MDLLFSQGVEKVMLPGTGHFLHRERLEAVDRRMEAALRRCILAQDLRNGHLATYPNVAVKLSGA